jgi:hypothetical protein
MRRIERPALLILAAALAAAAMGGAIAVWLSA